MSSGIFDTAQTQTRSSLHAILRDAEPPTPARNWRLVGTALVATLALAIVASLAPQVALVIAGLIAVALLIWSVQFLLRYPIYLIFMLVVIEEIPSLVPLDDNARVLARYTLYAILLIPTVPLAVRTNLLGRGAFRLYAVYFTWALITVAYSIAPMYSAGRLIGASLSFVALVAAIGQVDDESKATDAIFLALMALSALLILLALAELVLPSSITWSHPVAGDPESYGVPRFKGMFENPNQVGSVTLPSVTMGLVLWPRLFGWRRRSAALAVVLGLILTLMADSRSVLVSIGIGCACYVIWRYRLKGFLVCVALALAAIGTLATVESDYFLRGAGTLTGRTDIWRYTVARMWEHPLLGYGYQVDGAIFDSRDFPLWWGPWFEGPRSSLHNAYLSRAIGLGIPCTALWLYLILKPFAGLFRRGSDPWGLKAAFFLLVVPMLVRSMAEADVDDCVFPAGVALATIWALAAREGLINFDRMRAEARIRRTPTIAAALGTLVFLFIFCAAKGSASALTYYVDPNGSDANAGSSQSSAWRSLGKVSGSILQPGDVVALKAGSEWRETLAPRSSGMAGNPITFTRYGVGPPPIISGAEIVSGWRREGNGTWSAHLDSAPGNIFAGTERDWGLDHVDPGSSITMAPESWTWSDGRLVVRLAGDASPMTTIVEAAVRDDGFVIDGAHSNNNGVAAIDYSYSGGRGGRSGSIAGHINYIIVDGIEVRRTSGWGIHFYDSISPIVRNCIVHETGPGRRDLKYQNAIHVDIGPHALFDNNQVSFSGGHGNAINCQRADGATISGNHVRNWHHNGLDIKESSSVVVVGNLAENSTDGSGVYGEYDSDLDVSGNTIRNVVTGVQVNLGTSARITGNSIVDAATAIFLGPRGAIATVANNCARNSHFALIDAGRDPLIEDHDDWGPESSVKLGEQFYQTVAKYQAAGYGIHDGPNSAVACR